MSLRKWICAGLVWAVSLVAAGAWAHAQVIIQRPDIVQNPPAPPPPPPPPPTVGSVLSGSNIGFRVMGFKAGKPVGVWVVRFGPTWVEPEVSN
jgi:hypothetical protein